MSLRLRQAIPGQPSSHCVQNVSTVTTQGKAFIAYTSSSNVVVLDHDVQLVDTLQFWSALPHRAASSSRTQVEGVLGISSHGLIIAWSGTHLVFWKYSSSKGKTGWIVHSTLVVGSGVTSVDYINGTLSAATTEGIELWRMDPTAAVIVWDRLWVRPYPGASSILICPSLSHIAWYKIGARSVSVLTLNRKGDAVGMPQEIRQPREISWVGWRRSSTSPDAFLYTVTADNVFRIYSPVLDDPAWFQLLSSLDSRAFTSTPKIDQVKGRTSPPGCSAQGTIWALDAGILRQAVEAELHEIKEGNKKVGAGVTKTLDSLKNEEGDLVMWIGQDGTVSLRSVINIDRKPPTLLKSLPLARVSSAISPSLASMWSPRALLMAASHTSGLTAILPPKDSSSPVIASHISSSGLLMSSSQSITLAGAPTPEAESVNVQLSHDIDYLVRTPNGRGMLAATEQGEIAVWYKEQIGKVSRGQMAPKSIIGKGHWTRKTRPLASAIFAKGRAIVFYTSDRGEGVITLQHLDPGTTTPTPPVTMPDFELDLGDDIALLLAVSDIDDGYSGKGRRTQRAIVLAASKRGHAWVWRVDSRLNASSNSTMDETPDIRLLSHYVLPVEGGEPRLILPVDPMGWHQSVIDWKNDTPLQDMILTVSSNGVLEFWSPELGHHYKAERPHNQRVSNGDAPANGDDKPWSRTGVVRTGRNQIRMARCSSRKKTVLIAELANGRSEMTIWDHKISEFSTGLEVTHILQPEEAVRDLDWTTTSDLQSVLAVGFSHRVMLVCEQRLSYTESTPGWAPFLTIDLERYTAIPISDSIWLAGGSLAIGAGNQIYTFSRFLDRDSPTTSPAPSVKSLALDAGEVEDIFQLIAWQNGPLWDHHPTVLAQCLLWDKIDLVKRILVDLAESCQRADEDGKKRVDLRRLDPSAFFAQQATTQKPTQSAPRKYDGLFDQGPVIVEEEEEKFSPRLVKNLEEALQSGMTIALSRAERLQLAAVARAALEVEEQRRSLDRCGLRYLLSIRMAVNKVKRQGISGTVTPVNGRPASQTTPLRISFRNFVWATHSESQEMLLSAATETCDNGKMLWADAKRLGIFLWLKSNETIRSQLEIVARNRFMADEDRDPTSCSLIFFALGKKKVVHGLWRQAPGHKEQQLMLKFLNNDFELERWKTAAIKNAYALLSKQRYEYAAAFFMLGGCPKDAINVCLRQIDDWQLAYALARAVEGGTDGPLIKWVLSDTVVPLAMAGGHRWLATWAFWILGRRDLAVRVLISPMDDVAGSWTSDKPLTVGDPENDDPSLLLLFQLLKSKSLQTAKGTSEIPEKTEFDFVMHNARVFFRMGCHSLGLDLLRSWSFERPFFPSTKPRSRVSTLATPPTPLDGPPRRPSLTSNGSGSFIRPSPRRPSFMLSGHMRGESMVMDMDVLAEATSEPTSRVPSPPIASMPDGKSLVNGHSNGVPNGADDRSGAKPKSKDGGEVGEPVPIKKMGNLMKELKQDVQQGAMEFNMDNFF